MWQFFLTVLVELISSLSGIILLDWIEEHIRPFPYHGALLICDLVKISCAVLVSFTVAPTWKKLSRTWLKFDTLTPLVLSTGIAFAFVCLTATLWIPALDWTSVLMHVVGYFVVVGNMRTMLKYYPWTSREIILYKVVRGFIITIIVVLQIIDKTGTNNLAIAYFGAALSLNSSMFGTVSSKADEVVGKFKRERKEEYKTLIQPNADELLSIND